MELTAGLDPRAKNYRLFSKDTGEEILFAFYANDETGDYKVYKNDGKHIIHNSEIDGSEVFELSLHGNIELRKVS